MEPRRRAAFAPALIRRCSAVLAGLAVALAMAGVGTAHADGATIAVGQSSLTAHVNGLTPASATLDLVLANNAGTPATVRFQATLDDGTVSAVSHASAASADSVQIPAHTVQPVDLRLSIASAHQNSGVLSLTTGSDPAVSVPFTVSRSPSNADTWLPIWLAAIVALAVSVFAGLHAGWKRTLGRKRLGVSPKWSFHDSWAQNITALGAVLGTVLGASGFLSSQLPGLDTGTFVGLSLLAGGFVVAAPLLMLDRPNTTTFLLAAAATLYAGFLELLALVELLRYAQASSGEAALVGVLLGVAGLLLAVYGELTMQRTLKGVRRTHPPTNRRGVAAQEFGDDAPEASQELMVPLI